MCSVEEHCSLNLLHLLAQTELNSRVTNSNAQCSNEVVLFVGWNILSLNIPSVNGHTTQANLPVRTQIFKRSEPPRNLTFMLAVVLSNIYMLFDICRTRFTLVTAFTQQHTLTA